MNQDEIEARITSHGVKFVMAAIQGGMSDYENPGFYSAEAKRDHTPSVAAACRSCHIIARAKRATVEMPDLVKIRPKKGRITFIFADYTEVWFKKLDDRGWPSYRPSQQSLEFVGDSTTQPALDLPLPSEKEYWIAGYRPTGAANTEYEVLITGPAGDGKRWAVSLTGVEVQDLFSQPTVTPAAAAVIKKRVRIRREAKGKEATGNDGQS